MIASGIVCVRPSKLPAKIRVAPSSLRARVQHSTAPDSSAGRASGSVTRQNVRHSDTPSVRDTSSYVGSIASNPACNERTRNGAATKSCASTTAVVVNASSSPTSDSALPMMPRRPKATSSATPATVGGSTIGSSTRIVSSRCPGKRTRARR